jgi:lysophospholipase L1-like esterase
MGVGLNDAINEHGFDLDCFAANYERCLNALEKAAPNAAVLMMSNTNVHNTSKNTRQNSMMIQEFLRSTALVSHPAYFDLASATGGSENTLSWMENGWFKSDGIHFTPEGYQKISTLIFSALQDARKNWRNQSNPDRK